MSERDIQRSAVRLASIAGLIWADMDDEARDRYRASARRLRDLSELKADAAKHIKGASE